MGAVQLIEASVFPAVFRNVLVPQILPLIVNAIVVVMPEKIIIHESRGSGRGSGARATVPQMVSQLVEPKRLNVTFSAATGRTMKIVRDSKVVVKAPCCRGGRRQ